MGTVAQTFHRYSIAINKSAAPQNRLKSCCYSWLALLQDWSGFVNCFIDTLHADGPVVRSPAPKVRHWKACCALQCCVTRVLALTSFPVLQIEPLTTFLPAAARLVAIGDLHGDMGKTRRAFKIAGLIDANDRWTGGTTTAVQVNSCKTPLYTIKTRRAACHFAEHHVPCYVGHIILLHSA